MTLVKVARASDIPDGEVRAFTVDGRDVAVVNMGDGEYRAVDDICSHAHEHLSQGEVDPDFGTVRVTRVVSGFAAGRIINPKTAHSQAIGGIVGGLAYVFSGADEKIAKKVWDVSVRGTYVITPDHLKGNKAVRFLGVPPEEEAASEMSPGEPAPMVPGPPK